jgi:glycosyltransferase involved in cell wall biosynthesis
MNNYKLVSIIIPVYNGQAYLRETIECVLNQTYAPTEIIIVDDGSTDNSSGIVKKIRAPVKYIYQANSGTAAARNSGVKSASGSYFAFLDQDDLWIKDKLMLQVSVLENEPGTDIVFGHVKQFHSPDTDEHFRQTKLCPPSLMPGYLPSAMLISRDVFFRVGLFESAWQIGEWADWYVRATELNLNIKMLPELVTLRRIHNDNKGIILRQSRNEYLHILKASLDRRRSF